MVLVKVHLCIVNLLFYCRHISFLHSVELNELGFGRKINVNGIYCLETTAYLTFTSDLKNCSKEEITVDIDLL